MTSTTTPDGVRSTDPASRAMYILGLGLVLVAGLCFPGLGLIVSLVLGSTLFKHRSGDATRLNALGLLLLLLWLVGLGVYALVSLL